MKGRTASISTRNLGSANDRSPVLSSTVLRFVNLIKERLTRFQVKNLKKSGCHLRMKLAETPNQFADKDC